MAGGRWSYFSVVAIAGFHTLTQAVCHDYVLISTRGTFEPQGPSSGFTGMINATLETIPNGSEYDTIYPASANLTGAFDGVTNMIQFIEAGVRACPKQKYALLGYSQGATVTDVALHNFTDTSSAAYQAIQAILVIGNPGHVPRAAANVDEYGSNSTRNGTGWYYLNGSGAIPDVFYAGNKVLDICFRGDHVCEVPANGSGGVTAPHLLYGSTPYVQTLGAEFLIEKLDEALPVAPSSNWTSSPISNCNATNSSTTRPAFTGDAMHLRPLVTPILFLTFISGLAFS